MRNIFLPLAICFLIINGQSVKAQATGDYRSAGSGNWSTLAWEMYNGTAWVGPAAAPDNTAGQINILAGHSVAVTTPTTADQLMVNTGATLTINVNSGLTLADGAGDDLMISGEVILANGSLGAPGTTLVQPSGKLTFAEPVGSYIGGNVTNNGTMEWNSGNLGFAANCAFINNASFIINGNNTMQNGISFPGALVNTGTITKTSSGITQFTMNNGVQNSGTINLNAGTITATVTVTNTGNLVFNSGSFIHQGTFNYNGGSITGTGSFTNSGVLNLNADLEFPSTLIFSMDPATTTTGPGDLTLNQDFVLDATISGTGILVIHGNTTWNSRTIGRSFTVEAGRSLTLATAAGKVIAAPITNNGQMNWQDGDILFYANTILTNNGNLNISGNNELRNGDSFGAFANTGTITKTSSGTTSFAGFNGVNNSGTINLNAGTITTTYTFTNTGNLAFNSGSFIHQGTFNHNGGSMTGMGYFTNSGLLNLNVDQEFPSTLIFSMDPATTTTGTGNLTLNQDFVLDATINGTGILVIHGNMTWNGRTIGRSFTVEAGRSLTLATAGAKVIAGPITNNGDIIWQDGNILFYANTVLTNNGNLRILGDNEMRNGDSFGNFTNNGTVSKSSAGATTFELVYFTNNSSGIIRGVGTINMSEGSISVYTHNGIIAPGLSPGILAVNSGQPLSSASTLAIEMQDGSGAGTGHDQLTRNSDLILAGTLTVTETGTVPNGTYTIVSLSSGSVSGAFNNMNLPPGYSVIINTNNVQLKKDLVVTPVKLISFIASPQNNKVLLQWITENEINNHHFVIERSSNGANFDSIGRVEASAATATRKEYSFTDQQPLNTTNYYRFKQVDLDGRFEYSPTVKAIIGSQNGFVTIYPNPVKNILQIRFNNTGSRVLISIIDIQGRQVISEQASNQPVLQISVLNLPPGFYYVKTTDGISITVLPFIKQ